jgi:hypothetical protein
MHQPSPLYVSNSVENHNNSRRNARATHAKVRQPNFKIVVVSILIPQDVRRALH